jgi:hypothetical protein
VPGGEAGEPTRGTLWREAGTGIREHSRARWRRRRLHNRINETRADSKTGARDAAGRIDYACPAHRPRLDFRRPDTRAEASSGNGTARSRPGTFDLLGFTHYWARSCKGYLVVKQKTAKDRLRRSLKRVADWCRRYRHQPAREQLAALRRKLLGHFGYFGITGNYPALHNFWRRVIDVWRVWLSRRSQRAWISIERMERLLEHYPLPTPRLRISPVT